MMPEFRHLSRTRVKKIIMSFLCLTSLTAFFILSMQTLLILQTMLSIAQFHTSMMGYIYITIRNCIFKKGVNRLFFIIFNDAFMYVFKKFYEKVSPKF